MTKDIIVGSVNTIIGYGATIFITLEDVNMILGMLVGLATTIYLTIKIIKILRDLRVK